MSLIDDFFKAIDDAWHAKTVTKTRLRVFGSSALMMQTTYARGTKDSDVLETSDLSNEVKEQLLRLAGVDAPLAIRHRLYLEIVPNGVPFFPHAPKWIQHDLELAHFSLEVLDVTDVVVSKVKRFHGDDRDDIAAMIDGGYVEHAEVVERFKSAVDLFAHDARASDLPRIVRNFNRVEEDFFDVEPTKIELPDWD